jgi:hypothetical protein
MPARTEILLPMTTTYLRIPLSEALDWGADERLSQAAERAELEYDGGEEEGEFEVHVFENVAPNALRDFAKSVLPKDVSVIVTGPNEVTVQITNPRWLKPLGPNEHPYNRALHALTQRVSDDPAWQEWWSKSGYRQLWFQERHGTTPAIRFDGESTPGVLFVRSQVDLFVLDRDHPVKGEATQAAHRNLEFVLDRTAEWLGRPRPPLPG